MTIRPRFLYQGRGLEPAEARKIALGFFETDPKKPRLVGPVSVEIGQNYGLNETEALLDGLVGEGILRHATAHELGSDEQKGYFLVRRSAPPVY